MERRITTHTAAANDPLTVRAHGRPNALGVSNRYLITVDPRVMPLGTSAVLCDLRFQEGPPDVAGTNGITIEALLAVCADRLDAFQNGALPCVYNAHALAFIRGALEELHARTRSRQARGVLGQQAA